MRTKRIELSTLKGHHHPASKLFRTIELQAVYQNTKRLLFRQPSMDLGGGDGYLSSILFDSRFTYNVDNGEAKDLHIARRTKRYHRILVESAEQMSLRSNTLQFVFSNSVIEHIPDIEAVLRETARVLKKGGYFVFTSPSHNFKEFLFLSNVLERWHLGFLAQLYKRMRNKMLNHYHNYSHTEWTRRLKKHGLKVHTYAYYISKETCMLWDQIALETKLRKLFDTNADQAVFLKYQKRIADAIRRDYVNGTRGASVFILAKKV